MAAQGKNIPIKRSLEKIFKKMNILKTSLKDKKYITSQKGCQTTFVLKTNTFQERFFPNK